MFAKILSVVLFGLVLRWVPDPEQDLDPGMTWNVGTGINFSEPHNNMLSI